MTIRKPEMDRKPFECYCGAIFASEADYREHQKTHPERRRAASAGNENQADAQRPREEGQTEEERHKWAHTKK